MFVSGYLCVHVYILHSFTITSMMFISGYFSVHMCVCVCVCMHACVWACVYVSMHVHVCFLLSIKTRKNGYKKTNTEEWLQKKQIPRKYPASALISLCSTRWYIDAWWFPTCSHLFPTSMLPNSILIPYTAGLVHYSVPFLRPNFFQTRKHLSLSSPDF